MTPDNELPIWPFQPNWREAITERLTWLSAVLTSDTGAVQSYAGRLSPRREFEALFNPHGDERTFFDLFLSELGRQEMMVPLWHDRHRLTSAVEDGDNRIDCSTEYGEFMDGGMALLIGDDPWSHQAVEIDEVDETGFTLAVAADFDWPVNGVILPLRRSRIDLQPSLTNFTSAVGNTTLRFTLNQANELPDYGEWTGLTLDGYPVLTTPTNWREQVEMEFSGITETEDNSTGLVFIRDIADRAFRTKNHLWMLRGRQENWEFRQFLYRMGGRRNPVYIPTGAQDMVVATDAAAGANNVQVRRVGLAYVGGPQPGRDRFLVTTPEGVQARRITGLGVPSLTFYERLNLNAVLTYALPVGSELSFLEAMRADGDSIELQHHTDTEGLTECSINFRSFSDTRNGAGTNFVAFPTGDMEATGCGAPAEGEGLCFPVAFDGWAWEWVWVESREGISETVPSAPFCSLTYPEGGGTFFSNEGDTNPTGPKVSYTEEVIGFTRYQRMRMYNIPPPGTYHVVMDQPNLYPLTHFYFTGRPYTSPTPFTYLDFGNISGSFSEEGDFDKLD